MCKKESQQNLKALNVIYLTNISIHFLLHIIYIWHLQLSKNLFPKNGRKFC